MQGNGKSENERIHNWKGRKGCWCRRGDDSLLRKERIDRATAITGHLSYVSEDRCWTNQICKTRPKELAQRKVDAILDKIAGLKKAEATLSDLVEQCSGEGPVEGCPIIEAFIDDEFREES